MWGRSQKRLVSVKKKLEWCNAYNTRFPNESDGSYAFNKPGKWSITARTETNDFDKSWNIFHNLHTCPQQALGLAIRQPSAAPRRPSTTTRPPEYRPVYGGHSPTLSLHKRSSGAAELLSSGRVSSALIYINNWRAPTSVGTPGRRAVPHYTSAVHISPTTVDVRPLV